MKCHKTLCVLVLGIILPLLLVAGLSGAISCNYYREDIIGLLYHNVAPESSRIFGLLMIGFLFVSTSYLYGTLLTANNNLRQLNIVAAFTVAINITLNLILIPRHQALGAATASLVSQGFYATAQWILAFRLLGLPSNKDILVKLAAFLAINLLTGYLSLQIPGWLPGFLLLLTSCVLTSLLLGLVRPSEIRAILKE